MAIDISRFVNRETGLFTVEVLTPMFLGGADGNGELRSPPFKNALRYWWRLTQGEVPPNQLIEKEQVLFGGVNEDGAMESGRSRVDVVVKGDVKKDKKGKPIYIGEKINLEAGGKKVSLSAYLGMGPVHFRGTYEKAPILAGESFSLSVTWPREQKDEILDAISMFAHFGGLGSRSRNGWGSIRLSSESPNPDDTKENPLAPCTASSSTVKLRTFGDLYKKYGEDIGRIFKQDKKYPFKLGIRGSTDNPHPLLWKIASGSTWKHVMQKAAEHYMDVRQVLKLPKTKPSGVQKRHIVGYPVTNHNVHQWGGGNGRMPSQLRIVIRKNKDQYSSYFFHLPHLIAPPWNAGLGSQLSVWSEIHSWLDSNCIKITL